MKFLLSLFILSTFLLASHLEQNYKELNSALDSISKEFSIEEKTSLYYLILATHDHLLSLHTSNKLKADTLQVLQSKTLNLLNKIQTNQNLDEKSIQRVKNLYLTMYQAAKKDMKENVPQKVKTIYKEKIIYQDRVIKEKDFFLLFIVAFCTFTITSLVTYFLIKKKVYKKEPLPFHEEIEKQNTELHQQRMQTQQQIASLKEKNQQLEKKLEKVIKNNK